MQLIRILQALSLIFVCVAAASPQKQVLITYPQDIPQSELDVHRKEITSAVSWTIDLDKKCNLINKSCQGGEIVHEYHLIKGFIVKISTEALDSISSWMQKLDKYKPVIEDDQTVSIQN